MDFIVGVFILAPASASGACGDYLITRGHSSPNLAHREVSVSGAVMPQLPAQVPLAPCDGPACRQSVPPAMPLPAAQVRAVFQESAILMPQASSPPSPCAGGHTMVMSLATQCVGGGIFHPPRDVD
jgi:hypothetical protein